VFGVRARAQTPNHPTKNNRQMILFQQGLRLFVIKVNPG
jgi:hypothetical protein